MAEIEKPKNTQNLRKQNNTIIFSISAILRNTFHYHLSPSRKSSNTVAKTSLSKNVLKRNTNTQAHATSYQEKKHENAIFIAEDKRHK